MRNLFKNTLAMLAIFTMALPSSGQVVEGKYPREFNAESSWIKDGNAEAYVKGWTGYNDSAAVPVDGTGGTVAGVTIATTTTTPLEGKKSFVITKDAANRQGIGFAIPLTIDSAFKNDANTIYFKFDSTSGTFVAGTDIKIYLYDVTNARLVNLTSNSLRTDTNGTYAESFQATGSTSYKLLVHLASTSALAYNYRMDSLRSYAGLTIGGVPKNTFDAHVLSGGNLSKQTTPNVFGSPCVITDTSLYTCSLSGLSSAPYCELTPYSTGTLAVAYVTDISSTSLQYRTYVNGSKVVSEVFIKCTKSGADYIQNFLSAPNWNFDWRDYSGSIVSQSGTLPSRTLQYMQYMRKGGQMYLRGQFTFNAAGTWAGLVVPYPPGITGSASVATLTTNAVGLNDISDTIYIGTGFATASNLTIFGQQSATAGKFAQLTQAVPFTWVSGDSISWVFGPVDAIENGQSWGETWNAIQLNGSVNSGGPGKVITGIFVSTNNTACATSTCGFQTNGKSDMISSVTRSGSGRYTVNVPAGMCSGPVSCAGNSVAPGVNQGVLSWVSSSATAYDFYSLNVGNLTVSVDSALNLICSCVAP